jgi:hypothetical protein
MGGSKPAPAPAPAPVVVKKAPDTAEALRRRRIAEGRTEIVSTEDTDSTGATKKLLGEG